MERLNSGRVVQLELEVNSTIGNSSAAVDKIKSVVAGYSELVVTNRLEAMDLTTDVLNGVEVEGGDTAGGREERHFPRVPSAHVPGHLRHDRRDVYGHGYLRGRERAQDPGSPADDPRFAYRDRHREIPGGGDGIRRYHPSLDDRHLRHRSVYLQVHGRNGSDPRYQRGADHAARGGAVGGDVRCALLLAVSIFARNYKEAQNYVTPLYLLAVLPVIVANAMPSGQSPLLFIIPGFNAVILFRELLIGEFVTSHIVITVVSNIVYTFFSIRYAAKIYARDDYVLVDEGRAPRISGKKRRNVL